MKRIIGTLVVLVMLLTQIETASSGITYIGQSVQPVSGTVGANLQVLGSAIDTGKANTGNATPRVVIANDDTVKISADAAIKVDGSAITQPISATSLPLPTGAATSAKQPALGIAGTPSADVITVQGATSMTSIKVDGSAVTQPVSISGAIPTNIQVLGTAVDTGKGITGNATLRVVVASDADTVKIMFQPSAAPTITKVIATTTSQQLLAANVNRKGIECATDCTDTSKIYINFGASAATTNNWPIEICSSWEPPATVVPTSALQVVAAVGDAAAVRCIEY